MRHNTSSSVTVRGLKLNVDIVPFRLSRRLGCFQGRRLVGVVKYDELIIASIKAASQSRFIRTLLARYANRLDTIDCPPVCSYCTSECESHDKTNHDQQCNFVRLHVVAAWWHINSSAEDEVVAAGRSGAHGLSSASGAQAARLETGHWCERERKRKGLTKNVFLTYMYHLSNCLLRHLGRILS